MRRASEARAAWWTLARLAGDGGEGVAGARGEGGARSGARGAALGAARGVALGVALGVLLWSRAAALAAPGEGEPARLAVLEVQGALGALEERQAWSDALRAAALSLLQGAGGGATIGVIDRAQFELLLPPSADLEACVGMCEAQVARAVGARWSLSARLSAEGGAGAARWTLTLKLHAADGALLAVAQRPGLAAAEVPGALAPLAAEALAPLAPARAAGGADRLSGKRSGVLSSAPSGGVPGAPPPAPTPPPMEEEGAWTHRAAGLRWRLLATAEGALCLSERVPAARYAECARAGRCAPAGAWGRCPGAAAPAWAPQTCVDAQQAARFASALGGAVPSEALLAALYESCPACAQARDGVAEWALTEEEQGRLAALPAPALRAAPRVAARALGATRRLAPPSFRVPDVAFRVARPAVGGGCGSEP